MNNINFENNNNNKLLKCFIFYDIIFVLLFCLDGFIHYSSNPFLDLFIVITLLSYLPLYYYLNDSSNIFNINTTLNKYWHLSHINTCLLYCALRITTLFIYFTAIIIDISHIDIPHTILHIPILSRIVLFTSIILIIILCLLTIRIRAKHQQEVFNTLTNIQINANVYYFDNDKQSTEFIQEYVNDLQKFTLTREIYLVPDSSAQSLSNIITLNLNNNNIADNGKFTMMP